MRLLDKFKKISACKYSLLYSNTKTVAVILYDIRNDHIM